MSTISAECLKNEGVAPTFYMKNKVNRIATLYYGLDDVVLTG